MSGGEIALIITGVCWMLALTVLVFLCVQQLTIVTKRLELIGGPTQIGESGPAVGMPVPEDTARLISLAGDGNGNGQGALILLMSATCGPCRGVAEELNDARVEMPLVVLLPGNHEAADEVAALLPARLEIVRDPEAADYASSLGIKHTPFALAVKNGRVVGKALINRVEDLRQLADAAADASIETLESV